MATAFSSWTPVAPSVKRSESLLPHEKQPSSNCTRQPIETSPSPSPPTCVAPPLSRRAFLHLVTSTATAATLSATLLPPPSHAVNGLHIFPLREPLTNTYYLMRACETASDAAGVMAANPVDKLSIDKLGLTTAGVSAATRAADALAAAGVSDDCWIWPSVTMSAFQTAEVVASSLLVRRDRIVPEFSFLDARGVGALEGRPVTQVRALLDENDRRDPAWRPPAGVDGTPNDSARDVWVRVNQLISKLETQYADEDIVVVSPDSDTLSVWQAVVTGLKLEQHPSLFFDPGEVRRVREVVVDAYGKVIRAPVSTKIFRSA